MEQADQHNTAVSCFNREMYDYVHRFLFSGGERRDFTFDLATTVYENAGRRGKGRCPSQNKRRIREETSS
jgi:hypothetical protein